MALLTESGSWKGARWEQTFQEIGTAGADVIAKGWDIRHIVVVSVGVVVSAGVADDLATRSDSGRAGGVVPHGAKWRARVDRERLTGLEDDDGS